MSYLNLLGGEGTNNTYNKVYKYQNEKYYSTQHVFKHVRNLRCSCNLSFERTIEGFRTC